MRPTIASRIFPLFMLGVPLTIGEVARCLGVRYRAARFAVEALKSRGLVQPTSDHVPPRFTNGRPAIPYTLAV